MMPPGGRRRTKGFTVVKEDLNDAAAYNRVLWEGTMGRTLSNHALGP
jgi:hypothetical protein